MPKPGRIDFLRNLAIYLFVWSGHFFKEQKTLQLQPNTVPQVDYSSEQSDTNPAATGDKGKVEMCEG